MAALLAFTSLLYSNVWLIRKVSFVRAEYLLGEEAKTWEKLTFKEWPLTPGEQELFYEGRPRFEPPFLARHFTGNLKKELPAITDQMLREIWEIVVDIEGRKIALQGVAEARFPDMTHIPTSEDIVAFEVQRQALDDELNRQVKQVIPEA